MIQILICDDHAIVRQGVRQLVEDCDDIVIAGEADSGEAAVRMVIKHDFDVVLMDISMDGIGGMEALTEMGHQKPELAVLMLSMHPEDQYAIRALKAGAAGYLTKTDTDELLLAIRTVATGKRYITPSVSEQLVYSLNADDHVLPHQTLSNREYQVLILLAEGQSVGEIADHLAISVKTVSTYKSRIFEKMNARNVVDLIRYALKHNLVI